MIEIGRLRDFYEKFPLGLFGKKITMHKYLRKYNKMITITVSVYILEFNYYWLNMRIDTY